jgi:hypothetical protein
MCQSHDVLPSKPPVIGLAGAGLVVARQRKDALSFVKPPDRLTSPDMLSGRRIIQANRDAEKKNQP